ncbi:alanine--glyoxylate aminotransferase family protein [bacterium]|nr:alanine--glyoxylate aminotransferase family protein [bacterium]
MLKHTLFTPGPTNVPPEVLQALGSPIVHHRAPDFEPIFQQAREGLQYVFRTQNPVVPLTSSGSGGMEAAVTSLLACGEKALSFEGGKFGERWGDICKAYGINVITHSVEWGTAATPEMVEKALKENPDAKAVFCTHCETSTGVLTDVEAIAKIVAKTDAVLVIDAVSSLGAEPLETDEWGVDVVVTGSQKALMLPPGMAFVSVSPKAEKMINQAKSTCFYFSLKAALKALAKNTTPWTGPVSMIVALNAAVDLLKKEGIENIWARHQRCAEAIRKGSEALGLSLFSKSPSNVVVALTVPAGVDAGKITKTMRDAFGMTITGGQEQLKGKIIRIAALGFVEEFDVLALIGALELSLIRQDHKCELGAGVAAALKSLNTSLSK